MLEAFDAAAGEGGAWQSHKRQCSEGREAGAGTDRAAGAARAAAGEGFRGAQEEAQGSKDPTRRPRRPKNGLGSPGAFFDQKAKAALAKTAGPRGRRSAISSAF